MFYVYLLRSKTGNQLYVGLTSDLQRRLQQHNAGDNTSTKRYRPWELVYYEAYMTYQLAESRENRLKYHGNAIRELKIRVGLLTRRISPATKSKKKSGAGFTLVEILLVTALFSMTMIIATTVFLIAQRSQRESSASQKLQDDTRAILETIVREVKSKTIDYSCYNQATETCYPSDLVSSTNVQLTATNGQTSVLVLRDAANVKKMFAVFIPTIPAGSTEKKLQTCTLDPSTEDAAKCMDENNWSVVTPAGVTVERTTFWVAPFVDPFAPCPADNANCNGVSPYQADEQPRVTIVLYTVPSSGTSKLGLSSQTTVISRLYLR